MRSEIKKSKGKEKPTSLNQLKRLNDELRGSYYQITSKNGKSYNEEKIVKVIRNIQRINELTFDESTSYNNDSFFMTDIINELFDTNGSLYMRNNGSLYLSQFESNGRYKKCPVSIVNNSKNLRIIKTPWRNDVGILLGDYSRSAEEIESSYKGLIKSFKGLVLDTEKVVGELSEIIKNISLIEDYSIYNKSYFITSVVKEKSGYNGNIRLDLTTTNSKLNLILDKKIPKFWGKTIYPLAIIDNSKNLAIIDSRGKHGHIIDGCFTNLPFCNKLDLEINELYDEIKDVIHYRKKLINAKNTKLSKP